MDHPAGPIGIIGPLGNAVASHGWNAIGRLGTFAGAIYLGLAVVLLVVYPVLLVVYPVPLRAHGLSVRHYFTGA